MKLRPEVVFPNAILKHIWKIEKGYQTSPFISDVNQEDKVNNFVDIDEAKQQLEKVETFYR